MKIFIETLFFTLAVFINSIELSSQVRSLAGPYPLHKPITIFRYLDIPEFQDFRKLTPERLVPLNANDILVARGDIVFGWKKGNLIQPLYDGHSSFIVHNLETHETFDKQVFDKLQRMGAFGPMPPNPQHHPRFAAHQRTN